MEVASVAKGFLREAAPVPMPPEVRRKLLLRFHGGHAVRRPTKPLQTKHLGGAKLLASKRPRGRTGCGFLKWGAIVGGGLIALVIGLVVFVFALGALSGPVQSGSDGGSSQPKALGQPWRITGEYDAGEGEQRLALTVTPSKDVDDPARTDTPPNEIPGESGNRWVRFDLRLANTGKQPYDFESNGFFFLIDSNGQRVIGNDVTPVGPGEQLSGTLLPGDRQSGTVLFLVPKGAEPRELRFEPVGSGGPVFRWRVRS